MLLKIAFYITVTTIDMTHPYRKTEKIWNFYYEIHHIESYGFTEWYQTETNPILIFRCQSLPGILNKSKQVSFHGYWVCPVGCRKIMKLAEMLKFMYILKGWNKSWTEPFRSCQLQQSDSQHISSSSSSAPFFCSQTTFLYWHPSKWKKSRECVLFKSFTSPYNKRLTAMVSG